MSLVRKRVFDLVRSDIISCALMPGMELREAELAQRYGVSKSPIRDAMQKLELEGLIEIEPRRGHRVRPISVKDAEDILELRVVLETAAVEKIAAVASAAELAALDRLREADTTSVEAFKAYNRQFHQTLGTMSRNARLAEETARVMDFYDRLCVISLSTLSRESGFEGPLADHVAIVDALQARNGRLAAKLVRRHVSKSRGQILRGLENRPIVG